MADDVSAERTCFKRLPELAAYLFNHFSFDKREVTTYFVVAGPIPGAIRVSGTIKPNARACIDPIPPNNGQRFGRRGVDSLDSSVHVVIIECCPAGFPKNSEWFVSDTETDRLPVAGSISGVARGPGTMVQPGCSAVARPVSPSSPAVRATAWTQLYEDEANPLQPPLPRHAVGAQSRIHGARRILRRARPLARDWSTLPSGWFGNIELKHPSERSSSGTARCCGQNAYN